MTASKTFTYESTTLKLMVSLNTVSSQFSYSHYQQFNDTTSRSAKLDATMHPKYDILMNSIIRLAYPSTILIITEKDTSETTSIISK